MIRFADVIGHGRAIATLQGAIQRGKVHHAYLLTGPPGIGRGSVARAMAAALLCHSGGVDACGACKPCQQLKAGAQADLRILGGDGKAVKVAEVRELIRWVALKPMGGKGRVAIVEEAQELSPSSANALLKTLEEPPPGTTFILITSSLHRTLPTVRSRCQKIPVSPLSTAQVEAVLVQRLGMDEAQAHALAPASGGSPGRAASLTEAALAFRAEVMDAVLGAGDRSVAERLALSEAHSKEKDRLGDAIDAVEALLRDAVVLRAAPGGALVHPEREEAIRAWSARLAPRTLFSRARLIREAREAAALNVSGRVILERLYLEMSP